MGSATELLELAVRIANEAGDLLLEHSRRPLGGIETKATPTDVVTDADRESEQLILARLTSARPDDGILAEEGDRRPSASGTMWIIDPLDGTVNFLFGIPVWAVSIAARDADGLLVAVTHDPSRAETFAALRGAGSTLNGRAIEVSSSDDPATAMIGTGFSYNADARRSQAERLVRVLPQVRDIRRAGSAAIDLAWLACGRLDGFYEAPMKPWDRAAGELLVTEAGGVVSPLAPPVGDDEGVVAAGPRLHPALRELVAG